MPAPERSATRVIVMKKVNGPAQAELGRGTLESQHGALAPSSRPFSPSRVFLAGMGKEIDGI